MGWIKDDDGQSQYVEVVNDFCLIKIERWEHGYFVSVANKDDEGEMSVPLKYFYAFQDARVFLTNLIRLIKQEQKS